jgi:hypothetical protein
MIHVIRVLKAYREELERDIFVQEKALKDEQFYFMTSIRKRRIKRDRKYLLDTNDAIKILNEVKRPTEQPNDSGQNVPQAD